MNLPTDKECKRHALTVHKCELQKQGIYTCQHCGKDCGNNSINLRCCLDTCLDGIECSPGKLYSFPYCNCGFPIEHNMIMHTIACGKKDKVKV